MTLHGVYMFEGDLCQSSVQIRDMLGSGKYIRFLFTPEVEEAAMIHPSLDTDNN